MQPSDDDDDEGGEDATNYKHAVDAVVICSDPVNRILSGGLEVDAGNAYLRQYWVNVHVWWRSLVQHLAFI